MFWNRMFFKVEKNVKIYNTVWFSFWKENFFTHPHTQNRQTLTYCKSGIPCNRSPGRRMYLPKYVRRCARQTWRRADRIRFGSIHASLTCFCVTESSDCGLTPVGRPAQNDHVNYSAADDPSSPHLTPSSGPGRCNDDDPSAGRWQRRRRAGPTVRGPRLRRTVGRPGPATMSDGRRTRHGDGGATRGPSLLQQHVVPREFDGGGVGGGGGSDLGGSGGDNRRIIGGTDAEIGEHTWQAAIALDGLFFCGGALIADRFVITAAHCVMTWDFFLNFC